MTLKKTLDREALARAVAGLKKQKKRIVFTNGCFDIVHSGHVACLEAARSLGDVLVAGLNSDASVREIKGPERPIVPLEHRSRVMAALACVDFVTAFDEPDPWNLINAVRPDVLVKGGDWAPNAIVGADIMEKTGGKTLSIPLVPGMSTSFIIDKILKTYKKK
ncbi:D-glycero-beta-D-manno-heptose 1-phosphate adenylyltransferase [Candidatus Desulfarcum epimagneticum]|uniref:D-glycero-beta-D-manno-heptose 1-phosphate adenylyltransferase n=1 Tax=uncultured Desulfobacteraceae bacterium TaxID=218296 RepID=A0A484HIH1_9BACT|nr:D-glycero-beta-D-manno-heptose 1-phosphate adenylyltransferase [uncultured Desulfobacteraceae bacterium]